MIEIIIISNPAHGAVTVDGSDVIYTSEEGYHGPDTFTYELYEDGILKGSRNICMTVSLDAGVKRWRPISPFCLVTGGSMQGWSTLEQYDSITLIATGVTKPNAQADPDYVPPVYNPIDCT